MGGLRSNYLLRLTTFIVIIYITDLIYRLTRYTLDDWISVNRLSLLISSGIYIAVFLYWTVTMYNRIMHSQVRTYFVLIGASIVLWISIRAIKWGAFREFAYGDRYSWYAYYIPMIIIPVLFLFVSLFIGESEKHKINKKWNLLFAAVLALLFMVFTNDLHQLVFIFDIDNYYNHIDYSHGVGYYVIVAFLVCVVITSMIVIIKKFILSSTNKKVSRLPIIILSFILVYNVAYIFKPNYGIGYYFLDFTIFTCAAIVVFLESFIVTRLIHSNQGHTEFFSMSDIHAQILSREGKVVFASDNSTDISAEIFRRLKNEMVVENDENTYLHLLDIKGGYVVWSRDVCALRAMIKELEDINDNLHHQVDVLLLENEQKSESAKQKKISDLHDIMAKEILPHSQKIQETINNNSAQSSEAINRLIFKSGMTSTYLKRKINLILIEQTEKHISSEEMKYSFLESFRMLLHQNKICEINILKNFELGLGVAILTYDLYQTIIEQTDYNFDVIYIVYNIRGDNIVFTVQISGDIDDSILQLKDFERRKIKALGGRIEVLDQDDYYHISLTIPMQ